MTHDEATQACIDLLDDIGKRHARRIMAQTIAKELEPDAMEAMVQECIEDFRDMSLKAGLCQNDINVGVDLLYASLVKEGGRIARAAIWEHGHA